MCIIIDFFTCVPATFFFAILFKVPHKALLPSSLLGGVGFTLFKTLSTPQFSEMGAYFIATLIITICSEILARIMKMPATIFTVPAIIPLVPGIGLYTTMMYLVQNQRTMASQTGASTLLAIVAMAMAMVLTSILTKSIHTGISAIQTKFK
ncbi:MAG: threonine/serine exporter family protein [Eubacteriales bacterium]